MVKALISALLLSSLSLRAYTVVGKTVITDGSSGDTSSAVVYAQNQGQDGWSVVIGTPGGSYTWTNEVDILATHAMTLCGASSNNPTTINFNHSQNFGLYINASSSNHLFVVQNLIFNNGGSVPSSAIIELDGQGVCFRFTGLTFLTVATSKFDVQICGINSLAVPGPYGLIDHCSWVIPYADSWNFINIRHNGSAIHYSWTLPMSWGTTNQVVIEYCTVNVANQNHTGAFTESQGGSRYTVRDCNVTNESCSWHGFNSGDRDGTLQVEMYRNNFFVSQTISTAPYWLFMRGGTFRIWSNSVSQSISWNIGVGAQMIEECAESGNYQAESCDPSYGNNGLLIYPTNYPGPQQIGQGVANAAAGWPAGQGLVPGAFWGNSINVTASQFVIGDATLEDTNFIVWGRDITNAMPAGYVPLVDPHPLDGYLPPPVVQPTLINSLGRIARKPYLQ
jgi:hypothetical protein